MCAADKIRQLNDAFRKSFLGGRVVTTLGIANLDNLAEVLQRVRHYNDFTPDNDPHREHDFGAFDSGGHTIVWTIDYYGLDLDQGSPDPADDTVTARVLTVMMASEY